MKKILFVLLAAVLFSGCIEITTLVKVSSDGSGVIEEQVLISKEILNMIRELSEAMPAEEGEEQEPFNLFNETELRSQAYLFGEGVVYKNGEEISNELKEGFLAVYSFNDLNKVTINQNPNAKIPLGSIEEDNEPEEEVVRYQFTPGNPSEIKIHFVDLMDTDQSVIDSTILSDQSAETDTAFNEVAKLMKDMKIALYLETAGEITETNAEYRDGNRITLFDIDFNELLDNKDKLEEFKKLQPQTFEEFKKVVKDIPGIKVETSQPVIIKFNNK